MFSGMTQLENESISIKHLNFYAAVANGFYYKLYLITIYIINQIK